MQGTAVALGDGDVLDAAGPRGDADLGDLGESVRKEFVILAAPLELWAQRAVHATPAEDLFSG
ncbi:hypothetical protein [Streptomyces sp. NPDC058698]|uniref:hypothetical protein n=1 Tax=Streptomyces sp. NPDC058698 TaxID=3346606 RepID=UPI003652BC3E